MNATKTRTSAPGHPAPTGRRLGGLLVRKECWCLSLRGWIVAAALVVGAGTTALHSTYPFLASTLRVQGQFLVVEGWIPAYAVDEAAREFRSRPYQKVLATGGPMRFGVDLDPEDNYAEHGAGRLRRVGVDPKQIQAVPAPQADYDRTFTSALALKAWFKQNGVSVQALNVVTLGPHARRSRLMFEKAFGDSVTVGVIAVRDREYDPAHWWRYSEGVKEVLSETFAYFYARLLFHPGHPRNS